MPNNYDFDKVSDVKTVGVEADGWVTPLHVEYGTGLYGGIPSYYWRVKGTTHTFVIPILRMDFLSKGDYESHFKEILEGFRKEYLEWKQEGFYTEWMREYQDMFRSFISEG